MPRPSTKPSAPSFETSTASAWPFRWPSYESLLRLLVRKGEGKWQSIHAVRRFGPLIARVRQHISRCYRGSSLGSPTTARPVKLGASRLLRPYSAFPVQLICLKWSPLLSCQFSSLDFSTLCTSLLKWRIAICIRKLWRPCAVTATGSR